MRAIGLSLLAAITGVACGLDVVQFDVIEEGFVGMGSLQLPGMAAFGSTLQGELGSRGINPGDVDSMRALSGSLEMTSQGGVTDDLTFFARLRFLLEATGLEQRLLAEAPPISDGQKRVALDVTPHLEMKPYLEAGNFRVAVDALLDPLPPDRVDLRIVFRIRVDVNL